VYATLEQLRAEGVTPSDADDPRALGAIEQASRLVDQLCGWWFEPRQLILRLDGRGTPTLWTPVPPITLERLQVNEWRVPLDPDNLVIVGAPAAPGFDGPRLTRPYGVFPRGSGNVLATGLWGFTEPDGTPTGRVPLAIRRATLMLAIRALPGLGGDDAFEAMARARLVEERTREQSFRLADPVEAALTGDPELDRLLVPYVRPRQMGAA
jgi:hypothetical protein